MNRARGWLGSMCVLAGVVGACSSGGSGAFPEEDAGSSPHDAAVEAATGPRDASQSDGTTSGVCTSLTDSSKGAMPVFQGGAAPTASGGTPMDGTYTLGDVTQYSGAASTIAEYGTIRITGGVIERAEQSHHWTESVSPFGNVLSTTITCDSYGGVGRKETVPFTATSTYFREYVPFGGGTRARTFYKVTTTPDAGGTDASDAAVVDASSDTGVDTGVDAGLPDGCAANTTPVLGSVTCSGYTASSYTPSYVCAPELHFASTYEASSDHTKAYPATVNFNATGRPGAVLVLSSYEAVNWTVNVGASATLAKVIVLGYKASTVAVPSGVTVDNRTPYSTQRCNYNVSKSDPCVAYVQASTGGDIGSMHGCYNATSFTLQ